MFLKKRCEMESAEGSFGDQRGCLTVNFSVVSDEFYLERFAGVVHPSDSGPGASAVGSSSANIVVVPV